VIQRQEAKTLTRMNRQPIKYNHEFAPIAREFARIKMSLGVHIREIGLIRQNRGKIFQNLPLPYLYKINQDINMTILT